MIDFSSTMVEDTPWITPPEQKASEMNVSDLIMNLCESELSTSKNKKVRADLVIAKYFF